MQVDPKDHEQVKAEKAKLEQSLAEVERVKAVLERTKAELVKSKAAVEKERDEANSSKAKVVSQVSILVCPLLSLHALACLESGVDVRWWPVSR